MNPIDRRTLLTSLGGSLLLPLAGCGGGKKESSGSNFFVDLPTRGVGSLAWRTPLSLASQKKFVLRTRHNAADNTLGVITQTAIDPTRYTGPLTEYALDYNTGRVLREKVYPYDSPEAEKIKDFLSEAGRIRGLFQMDNSSSLTRLDPATQQPLWTYTVENPVYDDASVFIRSPIIAPDGTVYIVLDEAAAGYRQRVQALNAVTGRLQWTGDWFLRPTDTSGYPGISGVSGEVALSAEGLVFIEVGWIAYPGMDFSMVGTAMAILDTKTGKIVRGISMFDDRGVWNIGFTNPLLSPNGDAIGIYRDAVVAIRTK